MESAKRITTVSNLAVLYIQLVNGSRVSEAVEAFNRFLETGKRELEIRVRKIKKFETRRILIPSFIKRRGVPRKSGQVEVFAQRQGINTHSMRYAFIGYMGRRGVAPQIIAKITHHKKLDSILGYTQQKVADDLLDEVVK
jgi:site-specific recombinase XerD